eukprot:CAMPEP_0119015778 /NCGR_PEP_ID=MMETSP1176-20130426/11609_1 /TAXON_ID=265551 /ORGANISM="Synedropsis recta cf, Strain CCMP1620" /LENGTH=81 /DNA_ID=CAMNT_0006969099 /DNA_START=42 /DNA_END=287 /DNA_ORIENTATION=+
MLFSKSILQALALMALCLSVIAVETEPATPALRGFETNTERDLSSQVGGARGRRTREPRTREPRTREPRPSRGRGRGGRTI